MKLQIVLLTVLLSTSAFAVPPTSDTETFVDKFEMSSFEIENELNDLNQINDLVLENELSFDELSANHAELIESSNLSANLSDGIFGKASDSPLGIPGFWWGFCLGLIGTLVILIAMDEGADRKDQIKNSLIGCLISAAVSVALNFIIAGAG